MKELAKAYEPQLCEDQIYATWDKTGVFNPDNLNLDDHAPSYTIILPPPNITDKLHIGHASMLAIEDLLVRYHRMNGYRTLWLPGTDHAAIATQNVVEKRLFKEEGKTRHDLGREKFLERVWDFLTVTQSTILNQTRKMGASLDWSRLAFTLDETRQKAVRQMFIEMYEAGAIYRGERIVNWCPRCRTTLADDEVEYKEQTAKIYTFKYSADFPLSISTTRPETKLGDTAVAVNPKDERYKQYIGQTFKVNFCGQALEIKIIADRNVDMAFGTGALGVTPAHSMVDWQMAQQNDLNIIKVINEQGFIHEGFGEFSGKTAIEARELVVEKIRQAGLMEREEESVNNLSVCYRCDASVEPLPSKQWFIGVDKPLARFNGKSLKERGMEVAQSQEIKFVPERFTKRYLDWMTNLHDWCISRQIWFGHRIPVWYKNEEVFVGEVAPDETWTQDPDTLDTWFSSGMWSFSTLGWPDNFKDGIKSGDLLKFHPTQVLETGYEIITLWVSRMIMMSLFAINEIPFETVYLHGMVLDKDGKKMSKSKGNGVDPIDMIKLYGADAVRLSLLVGNTPGNDVRFSDEKVASYRNFINKLWNISRFILSNHDEVLDLEIDYNKLTLADSWVLSRFNQIIEKTQVSIKNYEFSVAGEALYEFTWNDFADWYLEATKFSKGSETPKILFNILKDLLKLWHPFIPFVTENIWSQLGEGKQLVVSSYPQVNKNLINQDCEVDFELIKNIIIAIRNARSENKVEPIKKIAAIIFAGDKINLISEQENLIKNLRTNLNSLEIKNSGEKIVGEIYTTTNNLDIYLIGGIDQEKEIKRLEKEIENFSKLINNLQTKLANQEFIARAPENIVLQEKQKLADYISDCEKIKNQLQQLK